MSANETPVDGERKSTLTKAIEIFEAFCHFFFYLFAFFIVIIPPLVWFQKLIGKSESQGPWTLILAILFALLMPVIAGPLANGVSTFFEKIKRGELLAWFFRPFQALCAVITIYGVLALEYKVVHGHSDQTLFEVFAELLKSL